MRFSRMLSLGIVDTADLLILGVSGGQFNCGCGMVDV